ncbi:MAG: hypothetical protein ACR2FM_03905 [Candidatus Saccharimonadales bacterium]
MKFLFMLLLVGFLAASPVYLLDNFVLPELDSLANSYRNADATAQGVVTAKSN